MKWEKRNVGLVNVQDQEVSMTAASWGEEGVLGAVNINRVLSDALENNGR